jgi:hypothetical protein
MVEDGDCSTIVPSWLLLRSRSLDMCMLYSQRIKEDDSDNNDNNNAGK